jgi:diguanylate cyclase (GGDEF)-like protein
MHRPYTLGNGDVHINININISIGVGCFPRDGRTAEQLVDRADAAMYAATAAGRDAWRTDRNPPRPGAPAG